MSENKLRVFEFRINGEKEWVAHFNMLNAVSWYYIEIDSSIHETKPSDDVVEIPESEWNAYKVVDEDGEPDISFAEAVLKCKNVPNWIATTLTT